MRLLDTDTSTTGVNTRDHPPHFRLRQGLELLKPGVVPPREGPGGASRRSGEGRSGPRQVAQYVGHDAAVEVVGPLPGVSIRTITSNPVTVPSGRVAVTLTVRGVMPEFNSVMPETAKISSPVRPRESAETPSGNWSGRTPIPIRLERWIRS